MLEFKDKYFVGIRKDGLGFATPDGTDAAAEKRKQTVKNWVGMRTGSNLEGENTIQTFDNKPIKGFSIGKCVSRWSTSNKLFRIYDPRGFELEISSANLAYLIASTTMVNGDIEEELVWARDGGNNYLCLTTHDDYVRRNASYQPKVGEWFYRDGELMRFIGKKYVMWAHEKQDHHLVGDYYSRRYEYSSEFTAGVDTKPVFLYETEDRGFYWTSVHVRRSKYPAKKNTAFFGEDPEVTSDLSIWHTPSNRLDAHGRHQKYFDTLEEAQDALPSNAEVAVSESETQFKARRTVYQEEQKRKRAAQNA